MVCQPQCGGRGVDPRSHGSEITGKMKNGAWRVVQRPTDSKVHRSRWVFAVKLHDDNSVAEIKTRFVGCGYSQTDNIAIGSESRRDRRTLPGGPDCWVKDGDYLTTLGVPFGNNLNEELFWLITATSGVERPLGRAQGISTAKPMFLSGACHSIPQGAHTPKTKAVSLPG